MEREAEIPASAGRMTEARGADALRALALVQQACAYRLAGDLDHARRSYEAFFTAWKEADTDVPILRQARTEYATLSR